MLSFKFVTNAGGAAHYFENTDDYYAKEGHRGIWQGEGAKLLGLAGGVERQVFKDLLEGKLPDGQQVRKKMPKLQKDGKKSQERLGIDFTFSAPKSVSIVALVNGDEALIRAHDEAVTAALQMMQGKALARKKMNGISFRQHTNNLAFATFRHELSRTQDPQLHTHSVAMNLTQRDDGKWVALTNDEMLKAVKVVGAYYRADLAKRLQALGYDIRTTRHGFELASVPDKVIKLFSKRSQQIEEALASKGLDRDSANSKTKQTVTKATRPNKDDADRVALREQWLSVLREAGVDLRSGPIDAAKQKVREVVVEIGRSVVPKSVQRHFEKKRTAVEKSKARESVDLAIEHLMERQGIFTKSELLERAYLTALSNYDGLESAVQEAIKEGKILAELPLFQSARSFSKDAQASTEDFQYAHFKHDDALKLTEDSWVALTIANTGKSQLEAERIVRDSISNGRLVRAEERFTTRTMLADELEILRTMSSGKGKVEAVGSESDAQKLLSATTLNNGQKAAATLILTTEDQIVGVQGYAGVGKSHMLKETVDGIKAATIAAAQERGFKIIGLAPYSSQNKALAELGMESQTLASFLLRKQDYGSLTSQSIVVLDEASVVPAHQMLDLMQKVTAANARLVLIGDVKQTQAVEAGKPFEQLVNGGMAVAHITEILRQKNEDLKKAVMSAAEGKVSQAAKQLAGRTVEMKDPELRHKTIANQYSKYTEDERQKTLIVVGTNEARREVNELVREALNLRGGASVRTLETVDMTRAEKKQAGNFEENQVVIFERAARGGEFTRGSQYTITQIDTKNNLLSVRAPDGSTIKMNPAAVQGFSAYRKEEIIVAPGDWVRMTRNNKALGIANGERYRVSKVTAAGVHLENGTELLRKDFLHMQHGYAMTVHSAQGATTDRVLIDADTKSLTSNRAVFYVAISRPRHELFIYTDDKSMLPEKAAREPKKYAAMELRTEDLERKLFAQEATRQALLKAMKPAAPVQPSKSIKKTTTKVLKR